jgi:alpha-D-ribose 1-methylphosphonate 5-triphosphate diphosphatase PhnM
MSRSNALIEAEEILEEKGLDLTEKDVELIDMLTSLFTVKERESDIGGLYEVIEMLRENPKAALYDNGST